MRSTHIEFETTINGGLPVLIEATLCPAEPGVGIFNEYVDDIRVFWVPRKYGAPKYAVPEAVFQKAASEFDRIEDEAYQSLADDREAWEEARAEYLYESRRLRDER